MGGGRTKRTAMVMTSDANFNDSDVVREFATSRDGTPVPIDILRRKGTRLDGHNPVLLTMGGAMGHGRDARLRRHAPRMARPRRRGRRRHAARRVESGEAWRDDGMRPKKQDSFDDFIAAADYLVKRGYTQPALLGIRGRGDGALVMGAALTQRPELFRAVVASTGRYDMLRLERDAAGEYDTPEFGSVEDRAQFDALSAYSPLRAVRDGAHYPAVLLLAGERDRARQSGAVAQDDGAAAAGDPSGRVILLRTDRSSGQSSQATVAELVDQATDEIGFFLNEVVAAQ